MYKMDKDYKKKDKEEKEIFDIKLRGSKYDKFSLYGDE